MANMNLAVLYGSRTCEHDVSIISAVQLMDAAEEAGYQVTPIYITREGEWYTGQALRDISVYKTFDPTDVRFMRVTLDVTPAAREALAIVGFDPVFGARPLKRLIQREVVDRIADQIVRGNLLERDHVLIDVDDEGKYSCRVEKPLDLDLDDLLA